MKTPTKPPIRPAMQNRNQSSISIYLDIGLRLIIIKDIGIPMIIPMIAPFNIPLKYFLFELRPANNPPIKCDNWIINKEKPYINRETPKLFE